MKTITPTIGQLRMLASIKGQQWMIRPEAVEEFALSALEIPEHASTRSRADMNDDDDDGDGWWSDYYTLRKSMFIDPDGIAHIQVRGALLNQCPPIYEKLGIATRYGTIIAETARAQQSGAAAILYEINSPGGTVSGIIECGQALSACPIPTASFCYGLACSAAYWLPCCTGAIIATPSALVGNVGAIITWADCDAFWADLGVTFKALVSEGADLKSTFHLEPDDTQLAFLQESIDEAGAAFRAQVEIGRAASGAELDPEVFRAGWYSGEKAGALGLIDAIGTADDAIQYLKQMVS